jgi:hypothetical protein
MGEFFGSSPPHLKQRWRRGGGFSGENPLGGGGAVLSVVSGRRMLVLLFFSFWPVMQQMVVVVGVLGVGKTGQRRDAAAMLLQRRWVTPVEDQVVHGG